jgi:sodium borate transporter 11
LILTVATVYFALQLAGFNKTRFFASKIRDAIADFAIPLAVVLATVVANVLTVELEPLPVPSKFAPTREGRDWIVNIFPEGSAGKCIGIGAVGAIPLFMLFFIDQNVTSLLTQHPEHNLKKGASFHYNFLILGVFNMIFPLFGCPYVTGSLPHSPQFTKALATKEITREGGQEKVNIIGVCENRISPLLVNVLILICLPIIGELNKVPTAVICDGLFLVMGISGLPGNELFERLKLMFTEPALYPPLHFSEQQVPRSRMHFFTMFQFSFVAILYAVARSPIALAFPVFLVSSIPSRMLMSRCSLGFITQDMVDILDHKTKPKSAEPADAEKAASKPDSRGADGPILEI